MDNVYIIGKSAFIEYRYLRSHGYMSKLQPLIGRSLNATTKIDILKDSFMIDDHILNSKIDLLVDHKNQEHNNKNINIHVCSSKFPNNSFLTLEKQMNISSPELTFCYLARDLTVEKLAMFGIELCGTYSMPNELASDFVRELKPITNAKQIQNYVKKLQKRYTKFRGIKNALEVSKYLVDNSASPQESRIYVLLSFPYKFGGFGINNIKLNIPVQLSKDAVRINRNKSLIPDLSICGNKIAIEYDSNQFHENANKNIQDKSRINALNHDGWQVFTFLPGCWKDIEALRSLCFDIAAANHQRPRIRNKNWDIRNRELIEALYF